MLGNAPVMVFIAVTDIGMAREFYESTLGLSVVEESPFALVVDANGTKLRITPVPELQPQPFTVAGWEVPDIEATVGALAARGVRFNRYDSMDQGPNGVWASPNGDLVAWFVDPDGNTLSLTTFASQRPLTESPGGGLVDT
jgi:catechol 2,3-dioxygenase-like lactoylglutathione lyase family enzyme